MINVRNTQTLIRKAEKLDQKEQHKPVARVSLTFRSHLWAVITQDLIEDEKTADAAAEKALQLLTEAQKNQQTALELLERWIKLKRKRGSFQQLRTRARVIALSLRVYLSVIEYQRDLLQHHTSILPNTNSTRYMTKKELEVEEKAIEILTKLMEKYDDDYSDVRDYMQGYVDEDDLPEPSLRVRSKKHGEVMNKMAEATHKQLTKSMRSK